MEENRDRISIITAEVVQETKKMLKENIYKIILYGSYARGNFEIESDIDIMIVMNCEKGKVSGYRKQISKVASRIGLENDIEISLLLRDKDTFEAGGKVIPFYKKYSQRWDCFIWIKINRFVLLLFGAGREVHQVCKNTVYIYHIRRYNKNG